MSTQNISGIVLIVLEFSSIIQFFIGGLLFCRITNEYQNKRASRLALSGVICCFTGGLPNACDKFHWVFGLDTIFNSNWMFIFVGIGFSLLSCSAVFLGSKNKPGKETVLMSTTLPTFLFLLRYIMSIPKPVKILFMLLATAGMIIYYSSIYRLAKRYIGRAAKWYIVSIVMTLVMSVISAICKDFTQYLPNILAQSSNNIAYIGFIFANKKWLKRLISENEISGEPQPISVAK